MCTADDSAERSKKAYAPLATTAHRIRFREVDVRPRADAPAPDDAKKEKKKKKRGPATLEEVVGGDGAQPGVVKPRRSRRSKADKGKGKERAGDEESATDGMDVDG